MSHAESGPLDGLVVADFSGVLAGPYAAMLPADLGADVIKVESPAGDDSRRWIPPATATGASTYYLAINKNKRSVALSQAAWSGSAWITNRSAPPTPESHRAAVRSAADRAR